LTADAAGANASQPPSLHAASVGRRWQQQKGRRRRNEWRLRDFDGDPSAAIAVVDVLEAIRRQEPLLLLTLLFLK
jgi:hypothetical protein